MTGARDSYVEDNFEEVVAAFEACGWKSVFEDDSHKGLASKSFALFQAAKEAEEDGKENRGRVLRLLAEACSMTLSSERSNEPFGPLWRDRQDRSIIPSDFTKSEIEFFAKITDSVDEPALKARLADLLWVRGVPGAFRFALEAIDSYTQAPPSPDTWFRDGEECWKRAISLSCMVGKASGNRLDKIESSIIKAIDTKSMDDTFFTYKLANTLKLGKLGKTHSAKVAKKLRSLADAFCSAGKFYAGGRHYGAAARWYKVSGNETISVKMTVAQAETFVNDAHARLSSDDPSHAVAAHFLESAVKVYRSIPGTHRDIHNVDKRIHRLRLRLHEHGDKALEQMATISSSSIDVTESVEKARIAVSGKDTLEALSSFASLYRTNVAQLRTFAIDGLNRFPLRSLFSTVVMSADGRTIAKPPAMNRSTPLEENEEAILAEMTSMHYGPTVNIVVQSLILPALDVLTLEHRLHAGDFIEIARRSPIVPLGREVLFGKALAEGYNRNFDVAIHLLAPQIEHMVRTQLKVADVSTTRLDVDGTETENGLSTLIDFPQTKEIFGSDLTYEIKSLFCDPLSANLRNNIAHGLLDDRQASSIEAIYAWWFGLKLVFNTFWNSLVTDSVDESQGQDDDDELSATADC